MSDELKRKPVGMDRRSFLRESSLLVAAAGLAYCAPSVARPSAPQTSPGQAGNQQPQQQPQQPARPAQTQQQPAEQPTQAEQQPAQAPPQPAQEQQAADERLYDGSGREYRICPLCGANMYKEGCTWTCEVCGYSYVE